MRIVYYSPHPTHDTQSNVGYSTHQHEMMEALSALGHEVCPVIIGDIALGGNSNANSNLQTRSSFSSVLKKIIPGKIWRTIKEPTWWFHDVRVAKSHLRKAVISFKPDLIYERSEYSLKSGSELAKEYGIRHIYEVNAPCVEEWVQLEGASYLSFVAHWIESRKYRYSSGLCPVSSSLAEYLVKHYQLDERRIRVIPNAINPDHLEIMRELRDELVQKLNLNSNHIVIGFVGSILDYHGIDELLLVFKKIVHKHQTLRLLIVGDGKHLSKYQDWVKVNGLNEFCTFTGKVPRNEVFTYIDLMDICLNPKHSWYGSPVKIFEYGAMGKAIIAPDSQNIRDVLTHMQNAVLISEGEESLTQALLLLIEDKGLRHQLGQDAKRLILSQFTWRNNAIRMIEFAESL